MGTNNDLQSLLDSLDKLKGELDNLLDMLPDEDDEDDELDEYEDDDEYDEDDDEYSGDDDEDEYDDGDEVITASSFQLNDDVSVSLDREVRFRPLYNDDNEIDHLYIGFGSGDCDDTDPDAVDLLFVPIDPDNSKATNLTPLVNSLLRDGDTVYFTDAERKTAFFTKHYRFTVGNTTTITELAQFALMSHDCIIMPGAMVYTIKHTNGEGSKLEDEHFEKNLNLLIQVMRSIRRNGAPVWNGQADVKLLRRKLYLDVSFNDYIDYAENQGKALYDNVLESFEGNTVHQYSDRVTFDLSNRYYLYYVIFNDCVRWFRFVYRKPERANFFVSVEELKGDALHNADALHKQRRDSDIMINANLTGFGDPAHRVSLFAGETINPEEGLKALCVNILLDGWILQIHDLYSGVDSLDDARALYTEIFRCVREIASSLRIDGKPVKIPGFDFSALKEQLCQTMLLNEDEKAPEPWGSEGREEEEEDEEEDYSEDEPDERFTAVTPDDELYTHYGNLRRAASRFSMPGVVYHSNNGKEHAALPLMRILAEQDKTDNAVYEGLDEFEIADRYNLKETALRMAHVFRVERSAFDSRHDDEGDIRDGYLEEKWQFSALRSFAWTLADLADREDRSIDDYDIEDLLEICGFIEEQEWLNYEGGSWFDGLCGHSDIHVCYMPQSMIDDGTADEICDLLSYAPIVSLEAFREELAELKNVMARIYNYLLEDRDRSERLTSPEAAVLKAWCVMAVSADRPFFSEDGPMVQFYSYPADPLNEDPLPVGRNSRAVKKSAHSPAGEEMPSYLEEAENYEIITGPDGQERVKLGEYPTGTPIIWLVLEKKNKELLLMSEFALDAVPFSGFDHVTNEWHDSSLRAWLNDDFYGEAFSDREKKMILEDTHDTYKTTSSGDEMTPPVPVTDKVFLPDVKEVVRYFPREKDRICKATAYAKSQGAKIELGPNQCSWWLRSPGVEMMHLAQWASSIRADGSCQPWGIYSADTCVRPVIRVKIDGAEAAAPKHSTEAQKPASASKFAPADEPLEDDGAEEFEDPRSCFRTVTFGCFPQSDPTVASPVQWLVLEDCGDYALLISKYVLGAAPAGAPYEGPAPEITANTWLHSIFNRLAFTKEEMQLSFNAVGLARLKGNEIHSGCFFLSADDAKKYFAKDELRQCGATYCAEQEGAFTDEDSGTCFWWLADNGNCYLYQAVVQSEGRVSTYGVPNQTTYVGMRPCIRVDKKAFTQKKRKAEKFDPAERDPKTFYERALNTMNEGHYARAYTLFSALFDYMDCITKEMECRQRWVEEFRRKKAAEAKTAAQNALSRADADRKAALSEQAAAKAEMDSAQAGLDAASAEKTRLTEELSQLRGLFTGKKRAQLNDQIRLTEEQIDSFRLHHKKAATACTNAGKRAAEAEKAQSEAKRKIAAAEAMMKDTSEPTREESSAFYAAVYKENNN